MAASAGEAPDRTSGGAAAPAAAVASLSFEAALRELEAIVGELERGDVPLDKSIEIYERGEALKQRCEALLRDAEMRVEKVRLTAAGAPEGIGPLDEG